MAELPSVEEILKVKAMKTAFQQAWNDSFTTKTHCCEQGGFIYGDPKSPKTKLSIKRAPPGKSDNQQNPVGENMAIDLNKPGTADKSLILVANFHTHPLDASVKGDPYPSRADKENAYYRQVPGIVISRAGIIRYGVERRTDMKNPNVYPPEAPPPPQILSEKKVGDPPNRAPNQWEPDTAQAWFTENYVLTENGAEEGQEVPHYVD